MYKRDLDVSGAAILDSDELFRYFQEAASTGQGPSGPAHRRAAHRPARHDKHAKPHPKNARGVSAALNRLEELLAKRCGISITRDRSGKGRSLQLSTTK